MNRFDAMDEVPVPDQWDEIQQRALSPAAKWPRDIVQHQHKAPFLRVVVPVVAVIAVVALAVGVISGGEEDSTVTAENPRSATVGPEGVAPGDADTTTTLQCAAGGIRASTIPTSATVLVDPIPGENIQGRSWILGDLTMELLLPGPAHIDFMGERTEDVSEPPGFLLFFQETTHFLGRTDSGDTSFTGPCDHFELIAAGGTEGSRREALLATVAGFEFDPSLGVTDCGELSLAPLQVSNGDTAIAAIRDLDVAAIGLPPHFAIAGASSLERRTDGRCDVTVATFGGLVPVATISGSDGTYGLDAIRGFRPDVFTGTVQLEVGASVQIQGSSYSIGVDYWCDDCATATLTLHYPDDDLTVTAELNEPGAFTGELPRPSTPGSDGWIAISWSSSDGEGRGLWTTNISSGDFTSG